jgi:hypothetical protein
MSQLKDTTKVIDLYLNKQDPKPEAEGEKDTRLKHKLSLIYPTPGEYTAMIEVVKDYLLQWDLLRDPIWAQQIASSLVYGQWRGSGTELHCELLGHYTKTGNSVYLTIKSEQAK